ncbi:myristoyl transferase [Alkalihalobacillus alcalophilus ATCC 27647 = CGMCC 1.3604]|uniref:Myristoyl transferase n=1 Tax=Alkalihalobacillus alcalophilus ATCC 27647 = CGMCC 1.3604 TaxID=1218173 RepID=A0A094WS08_ALKAL|nr:ABC transporter substrate-binding protein [Alkalihalobacillus alcalophilus]KGA98818.1 myristoyl transferase [Alkalihalobacillus alcalophilus ATCC 27647 = CGMCC 1.3604]MED1561001.1 ABC transporter substrate-binding protein [Alkalihalobacillus alcalophilus]THG91553.1 myristoyl transferase [Alkalihalobacillus alcalophilus ATCC 27647 = CGMCC 1.3604]
MIKKPKSRKWFIVVGLMVVSSLLAACGGASNDQSANTGSGSTGDLQELKLVLNWFPKSQHGGAYAAVEQGYFEEVGLDVTLEPGGPQVSGVQIVASGSAEFGLAHADQILLARNEGVEVKSIAAVMQSSPQAFMFHEGAGITDFEDLNGRATYVQPGVAYWEFLKGAYDLSGVEELAYTGQHVNFLGDLESVTQSFVTSEPYMLEKEGVPTETLLISESGYDPYQVVLFSTESYLEENEELTKGFVAAFLKGWEYYKEHSDEINEIIHEDNPEIALDELADEADKQIDFIFGHDATENGVGYMSEERWSLLIEQLYELELLNEKVEASQIFTSSFLP